MPDELSHSEDSDIYTKARIRRFAHSVLSPEDWFRAADELIAAMELLEPHIERHWEGLRSLVLADDQTSDVPPKHQKSDAPSKHQKSDVPLKHSLINQHMMLAGFAIENLCKGCLAYQLSHEERIAVQEGDLPKSLRGHDSLKLVEQTGMPLSEPQKYLLNRITEATLWRGRYPSPTSHKESRPFAQVGSDVRHIKTLLQKLRRHVEESLEHAIFE